MFHKSADEALGSRATMSPLSRAITTLGIVVALAATTVLSANGTLPTGAWFRSMTEDQRIAFFGVVFTVISSGFAALATKYARDAVREGHSALLVARNSSREQRAQRNVDGLMRLLPRLRDLQRAAATAETDPAKVAAALSDAKREVERELWPLPSAPLSEAHAALAMGIGATEVNRAATNAIQQATLLLETEQANLEILAKARV
jgi:hypothetical protein